MTCCKGVVKIREGLDGGWYAGGSTGNPIFEGKIDWQRYKKARIRKYAKELILFNSFWVENPQIFESIVEKVSQLDMFKLSSEL
jgi:hypothetical protein